MRKELAIVLFLLVISVISGWIYLIWFNPLLPEEQLSTVSKGLIAGNIVLVILSVCALGVKRYRLASVCSFLAFMPGGLYLLMNPMPFGLFGAAELVLLCIMIFSWWRSAE